MYCKRARGGRSCQTLILKRYDDAIDCYWAASKKNKKAYKLTRYLTIVLGAVVTLVASLQSAAFIKDATCWSTIMALLTPLRAASLAVVGGVSQAFQWGATWSEMTVTATQLQKERDRLAVTM